jgi:putative oxidoreductase
MQIAKQIPAYLLGLLFVVFGANHFFHFIPMPPMTGDPAAYMGVMGPSGYMTFVKICEILFGVLLILPKTRALGFILIAPIAVNILLFEVCIAKQPGIGVALVIITAIGLYLNKDKYAGILS